MPVACRVPQLLLLIMLLSGNLPQLFAQSGLLPFRDDFNRSTLGANWKTDFGWSIQSGSAYSPYDAGNLITDLNYAADSYIIETSAMGFTGSYWREFRITFGQDDVDDQKTYVLNYGPGTDGLLSLGRATDNIFYPDPLDQTSIYPALAQAQWYKFKIARYKSGLIQVYLDQGSGYGTLPVLEAIDSAYQQLGHFGWTISTQTAGEDFYVDWIEARKPEIEKPAVLEKPVEDDLITQVSAASGKVYKVAKLVNGTKMYTDRNYKITSIPAYLQGASFIQTANDDKGETNSLWLTTFMKKPVVVYIAYDVRAKILPDWLNEWHKTGDIIRTTDPGPGNMEVYSKTLEYWQQYPRPFILGANLASPAKGSNMNYLVIAVPVPASKNLEAEDAKVFGAKVANDHVGYSGRGFVDFVNQKQDYIEWTTQTEVPGTYNFGFQFANGDKISRSLRLTIDDILIGTSNFIPLSANWNNWAFYSGEKAYLKPGTHKIRITANGSSGPNIDYLIVNFNSDYPEQTLPGSYARTTAPDFEIVNPLIESRPMAYPNPFVSSTTITYVLPETAAVNLTVYTIQGQKQAVLVDQVQAAGKYEVKFNAGDQITGSGSYLYHLKQGNTVSVGKLIKQ